MDLKTDLSPRQLRKHVENPYMRDQKFGTGAIFEKLNETFEI